MILSVDFIALYGQLYRLQTLSVIIAVVISATRAAYLLCLLLSFPLLHRGRSGVNRVLLTLRSHVRPPDINLLLILSTVFIRFVCHPMHSVAVVPP